MAGGNGGPPLSPLFAKARAGMGVALLGVAVVIALIDALRTDVTVDPVQFFLICGSGLLALGVQGLERFMRP